jgi:hypothetical protein
MTLRKLYEERWNDNGANLALTECIEIKDEDDLLGTGAAPGTVPTDLEQATGIERYEILGKMQGIDIFDMKPLDASRMGEAQRILAYLVNFFLV